LDGIIPSDPNDKTMALEEIYRLDEEFCKYSFRRFASRLKAVREKIRENCNRADKDLAAFENYKRNHSPSIFSHKGYIHYQGSTAQELLLEDLENYTKDPEMQPYDLWISREEYRNEFPLEAFRKKIEQEIRTAKYLHTLRERGLHYKAS
jgi:hypothetical protein